MLSLSNGGMSSGQAGNYFAREDYYLKGGESSQWLGETAEAMQLRGQVREEQFRNVASGKSPDGSRQLVAPKLTRGEDGAQVENHRAGNDLTFSAPKSVSIGYAAGNRELKEIWDQAVINTMKYVEGHYSQYRTPHGVETAGNIIAAKFDHVTSRALDPEVHSHVFLVNMVHTREDGWQANEPKSIYTDKIAIGTLARQEAINLYERAGYQTYFTDREKLLFEIKGVRQEEIEAFSRRSSAIAERVAQWKQEGKYPGASDTILKQMAALDTRDPKRQVSQEDVRREWDRGFEVAGTTAGEVRERIEASKRLDQDKGEEPFLPEKNPDAPVKRAAGFLTDKEAVIDRAKLLQTAARISGGKHSIAALDAAVGTKNNLLFLGRERHGWQAGREYYTTREMRELEARNLATLKALEPFKSVTSKGEVRAYLKGLAGEAEAALTGEETHHLAAFRTGAASAAQSAPVILSAGQQEHLLNEVAGGRGFAVTQGDPGTGKTFVSGVVERFNAEVLEPTGREQQTVNIAYTGKAALAMAGASGKTAYTVDAFLNRYKDSHDPADILEIRQSAPKVAQVVIRLDEASFVGGRQAKQLLGVLQELKAHGLQVKLSMVGDSKQMQSIQASPFFLHASQLAREGDGDFAVMKEITRQKDAGLLEVAKALNLERDGRLLGTNAGDALQMLQQQGRVTELAEHRELVQATVEHYLREAARPSRDPARALAGEKQSVLVVTPLNSDRRELNEQIREARFRNGALGKSETIPVLTPVEQGVTAAGYHPGMGVIFTGQGDRKGSKTPKVTRANQQGEVVAVHPARNEVTLRFPNGKKGEAPTRSFDAFELAQEASLYRQEQREFAQGDQIVFGKNSRDRSILSSDDKKSVGVRNGERGEIQAIAVSEGNRVALVRLSDGRRVTVHLDRFGPQHIDHGYAVTVHKGQGETVDSVVFFNYVKPVSRNERNALQSLTRIEVSADQFSRWNGGLSDYEKGYRSGTRVGGHIGTVTFVMIDDRQQAQEQKGIAVHYLNGKAVVADEAARLQMREAGMYWSKDIDSWVTAVTNDRAISLMTAHPLRDQRYLAQLEDSFGREKMPGPAAVQKPLERNYRTAIDTSIDAERFGHASYNSFNVAMTRARYEARIFTNSVSGLRKAVQVLDEKTSTIGKHFELARGPVSNAPSLPKSPPLVTRQQLGRGLRLKRSR